MRFREAEQRKAEYQMIRPPTAGKLFKRAAGRYNRMAYGEGLATNQSSYRPL